MTAPAAPEPKAPTPAELQAQGLKLAMELGPLVVFLVANTFLGRFQAIGVFMVATVIGLVASYVRFKRVPVMLLVSGALVLIFGGIAYALHDETFFQLKPTIVNLLFAATMLIGLAFNWLVWKQLFSTVFQLTDEGWRKLQFRWGLFFIVLAGLNELARLTLSYDMWTWAKFGSFFLSFVFMMTQMPLLTRHALNNGVSVPASDSQS